MPTTVKFIEKERGCKGLGTHNGRSVFNGDRSSLWDEDKVLETVPVTGDNSVNGLKATVLSI